MYMYIYRRITDGDETEEGRIERERKRREREEFDGNEDDGDDYHQVQRST